MVSLSRRRIPVAALAGVIALLASVLVLGAGARPAQATVYPCFAEVPSLPGVIPPWGFHTSQPLTGSSGWYSRAYGNDDLSDNTISGKLCQVHFAKHREGLIVMQAKSPIISHTHTGEMWGYPGNLIRAHVKVTASTDRTCKVGTVGVITLFGSYNGVRSDSIQYSFPAACKHEDHLYHGSQVNAQVPPL